MKNSMKKILLSACLTACVGVAAVAVGSISVAPAKAEVTEETNYFSMVNGAEVRAVTDSCGLRFTTNVGEYMFTVTWADYDAVSFGTLIAKNVTDVTSVDAEVETSYLADIPCSKEAEFTNGVFTYTSAVVFNKADFTETEWVQASAMELTARAYVKLEKGGEITYDYATAVDTTRSMRAVANMAILQGKDGGLLNDYIGTPTRSTAFDAYETAEAVDGVTPLTVEAVASKDYTQAYINAKRVGTVAGTAVSFDEASVEAMGLTLGEKYKLSLFDESNNVYSMELMYVTDKLTESSDIKVFTIATDMTAAITGYYIMGNDITSTWADWSNYANKQSSSKHHSVGNYDSISVGFAGTFDGMGYTWTVDIDNWGIFGCLNNGALIKNVTFNVYAKTSQNNDSRKIPSVLAQMIETGDGGKIWIDLKNVFVNVLSNEHTSYNIPLFRTRQKTLRMENVIVKNDVYNSELNSGVMFFEDNIRTGSTSSQAYFKNTYAIVANPIENDFVYMTKCGTSYTLVANGETVSTVGASLNSYYNSIARYATLADLFATFNASNPNPLPWDYSNGALVWKN